MVLGWYGLAWLEGSVHLISNPHNDWALCLGDAPAHQHIFCCFPHSSHLTTYIYIYTVYKQFTCVYTYILNNPISMSIYIYIYYIPRHHILLRLVTLFQTISCVSLQAGECEAKVSLVLPQAVHHCGQLLLERSWVNRPECQKLEDVGRYQDRYQIIR